MLHCQHAGRRIKAGIRMGLKVCLVIAFVHILRMDQKTKNSFLQNIQWSTYKVASTTIKVATTGTDYTDNNDTTFINNSAASLYHKKITPGNHVNIPSPKERISPNGEEGYVQDPQWLQKRPYRFQIPIEESTELCSALGNGTEGKEGIVDALKIRKYIETSKKSRNVKLFCAVYTYGGGAAWTNVISETWGRKCDGLLFASDQNNNETGHMYLPSNSRRGFSYKGMYQRVRAILAYLYDNFLDDYDFFHIAGDDVYLIVENLKEYLASEEVRKWDEVPGQYLFAGFWVHWGGMKPGEFYLGGGSGYSISRKALKAFVEGPLQTCNTHFEGSSEDLKISECMRNLTSNKFIYTADSSGAHRYHQGPIWNHFWLKFVKLSLTHMRSPPLSIPQHYSKHEYTSNSSVAFHKHYRPLEMKRLELLLYKNMSIECKPFVKGEDEMINVGNSSDKICPDYDKSVVDSMYPIGFPQNLTLGRFHSQKGRPFLTGDFWADIVDNNRTFFLRNSEHGYPQVEMLRDWIRSRPHQIALVINNSHDLSWPSDLSNKTSYEVILNETNLYAVYAGNARRLDGYEKLKPIPIGLKWQFRSTALFGERKDKLAEIYSKHLSTNPQEAQQLFDNKNQSTVYFRSMLNSNRRTRNYVKDNPALQTTRYSIPAILNRTAKASMVWNFGKMSTSEYLEELKTHRFVISPPGNGLDTHATWEALLAGSIPIVPRSPLDSLFDDLPVWLVSSWDEVTDESVKMMDIHMKNKRYKWEKLFVPFWQHEIYSGLCHTNLELG